MDNKNQPAMPDVIWCMPSCGGTEQGKYHVNKYTCYNTSYTRTSLLAERAKIAAKNVFESCDYMVETSIEELTVIITEALKGQ